MKRFFLLAFVALALFSCKSNQKIKTYDIAEAEFLQSLNFHDTLSVLLIGQNFMESLKNGTFDDELANLYVVYNDTLYKVSDKSLQMLHDRFSGIKVTDYTLANYRFSTPGINDLSYRYTTHGKVADGPALKLMFNPVKVGDKWYLTLKDGGMSSFDKAPNAQVHPLSPAPAPIVLYNPAQ